MDETSKKTQSLREAMERRDLLYKKADREWRAFARGLGELIPRSMRKWAREREFTERNGAAWELPPFLERIARDAILSGEGPPSGIAERYSRGQTRVYGFTSLNALKQGFAALAGAWKGVTEIRVNDADEGCAVEVRYSAPIQSLDELDD